MSDYMVKMGAKPKTYEDHCHNTMGKMLSVIRYLMKGENDRAKYWFEEFVLPGLEEVYKDQDPKYGVSSFSMLYRRGEFDWDLICSSPL